MKRVLVSVLAIALLGVPSILGLTGPGTVRADGPADWISMDSGITNYLQGVWGSAWNDVFAVGGGGTILHYNGTSWSSMNSGTDQNSFGVWGSGPSDVFTVGDPWTVLHYDGSDWSSMAGAITGYDTYEMTEMQFSIKAVWGTSSSDVFAGGDFGGAVHYREDGSYNSFIMHFDGSDWSPMLFDDASTYAALAGSGLYVTAIWGTSSTDVFAVCANPYYGTGAILHYDGTVWRNMSAGAAEPLSPLLDIWGTGGTDVFAVGGTWWGGGPILHYDGSVWDTRDSPTTGELLGIWGSASNDVFAVGLPASGSVNDGLILHYDGSAWSTMVSGASWLNSIWGSSASDVFAVGLGGAILHYGGSGSGGEVQIAATVTPQSISVTIADGYPTAVDYGTLPLGAEGSPISYSPGAYSYLRVQNDGSVAENLLIKGADATCGTGTWILGNSGADQYSHLWGEGQAPESYSFLTTEASPLSSGVAGGATVDFNLKIRMPTSCTLWGQYSTTVAVLAVAAS